MLENCVLNSYLILLFSRKIPTFSYFLMKIPTFSCFFELSYYLTPGSIKNTSYCQFLTWANSLAWSTICGIN